jgi:mannose-6-phosphate isomerase-like protein (cupin superfamily)
MAPESQPRATVVRYEEPPLHNGRAIRLLCHTDALLAGVQFVSGGGEENLHSHRYLDGFWFVLRGRVRFYTTDDELVADLGPHEGVLVPREFPYWFESSGDETLEMLQVEASVKPNDGLLGFGEARTDYTPMRPEMEEVAVITVRDWSETHGPV